MARGLLLLRFASLIWISIQSTSSFAQQQQPLPGADLGAKLLAASVDKLTNALERKADTNDCAQDLASYFQSSINLEEKLEALELEIKELKTQLKEPKKEMVFFNVVSKKQASCYGCMLKFSNYVVAATCG